MKNKTLIISFIILLALGLFTYHYFHNLRDDIISMGDCARAWESEEVAYVKCSNIGGN